MPAAPYALGFQSLRQETIVKSLAVDGVFPDWLEGSLLRTGPAKFEVKGQSYSHWFDGLAMLHRFSFSRGAVSYANRSLRSNAYKKAVVQGRIARSEFGTDPCRSIFGRVLAIFLPRVTDNCNVNIARLGDSIVSMTETPMPYRFDPQTLDTLGPYDYRQYSGDKLPGQVSIAHPQFDAVRSCTYSYLIEFGRKCSYHLFRVDIPTGRKKVVASIPVQEPAYMHSFAATENYLILTEFPFVVRPLELIFSGKPFVSCYRWEPQRGIRFHVVEKDSGRLVKQATAEGRFGFHHVNAWEDGDQIFADVCMYPDVGLIDSLYLKNLRSGEAVPDNGVLARFCVDLKQGDEVSMEPVSDASFDLPRINDARCVGRPYTTVYGVGGAKPGAFADQLLKVNTQTGASQTWREEGCYPGEAVFVPAPSAVREDDGVALSVVLDARCGRSFLLALDANTFQEIGRAHVPHHIPFGFHGTYLESV